MKIREAISNYYTGWLVCDDRFCSFRTRQVSVYGSRCVVDGCRGTMHHEVGSLSKYRLIHVIGIGPECLQSNIVLVYFI
jgi:DNA polymerase alpha subunit A